MIKFCRVFLKLTEQRNARQKFIIRYSPFNTPQYKSRFSSEYARKTAFILRGHLTNNLF